MNSDFCLEDFESRGIEPRLVWGEVNDVMHVLLAEYHSFYLRLSDTEITVPATPRELRGFLLRVDEVVVTNQQASGQDRLLADFPQAESDMSLAPCLVSDEYRVEGSGARVYFFDDAAVPPLRERISQEFPFTLQLAFLYQELELLKVWPEICKLLGVLVPYYHILIRRVVGPQHTGPR